MFGCTVSLAHFSQADMQLCEVFETKEVTEGFAEFTHKLFAAVRQ